MLNLCKLFKKALAATTGECYTETRKRRKEERDMTMIWKDVDDLIFQDEEITSSER